MRKRATTIGMRSRRDQPEPGGGSDTLEAAASFAKLRQAKAVIRELLARDDPVNISYGEGEDAYASEIDAIVAQLCDCHSEQDVCSIIFEVLCRSFGPVVGSREHYSQMAKELWQLQSTSAARNGTDVNN